MKSSWLKRSIIILLTLDAFVGTVFAVYVYLTENATFFENYFLIIIYGIIFDFVAIVFLLIKLILLIIRKTKERKKALAEEKARLEEERQKELQRQRELEAERKRIAEVNHEISVIIKKYELPSHPEVPVNNYSPKYKEIENESVVSAVEKYKSIQTKDICKCKDIQKRISDILLITLDPDEKLKHLTDNTDLLDSLKDNFEKTLRQIQTRKITFSSKCLGKPVLEQLFEAIKMSKSHICNLIPIDKLIFNGRKPRDLSLFNTKTKFLTLKYNSYFYCVSDDIILVFNNDGIFVTALKPSSLLLNFKKAKHTVDVSNDRTSYTDFTNEDSKVLQTGNTSISWLYERKGGGPDRRHSYNPCTMYRQDTLEYGKLQFTLMDQVFTISFSSEESIKKVIQLCTYNPKQYDNAVLCDVKFD